MLLVGVGQKQGHRNVASRGGAEMLLVGVGQK